MKKLLVTLVYNKAKIQAEFLPMAWLGPYARYPKDLEPRHMILSKTQALQEINKELPYCMRVTMTHLPDHFPSNIRDILAATVPAGTCSRCGHEQRQFQKNGALLCLHCLDNGETGLNAEELKGDL